MVARRPSGRSCRAKHSSPSSLLLLLPQSWAFQGEFEPLAWEGSEVNTGRATVDLSMQNKLCVYKPLRLEDCWFMQLNPGRATPAGPRKEQRPADRLSVPTPGPPG